MPEQAERIRQLCTLVTTTTDEAILLNGLHELKAAITVHIEHMRSQAAKDIARFSRPDVI
jgi:hypothetical protein